MLPDEVVRLLGSPEDAAERAKEALLLQLLRQGRIGQGKVAQLLGIDRWALLDLMAKHQVPSGPVDAADMRRELEELESFAGSAQPGDRAGDLR